MQKPFNKNSTSRKINFFEYIILLVNFSKIIHRVPEISKQNKQRNSSKNSILKKSHLSPKDRSFKKRNLSKISA